MFTADSNLDIGSLSFTSLDCNLYELPDASLVNALKWVVPQDVHVKVVRQKCVNVVTAESETHLCQIICAKGENRRLYPTIRIG